MSRSPQPLVGRAPVAAVVVAHQQPAHLDAGVEPLGRGGVAGQVAGAGRLGRVRREDSAGTAFAYPRQFRPPLSGSPVIERRRPGAGEQRSGQCPQREDVETGHVGAGPGPALAAVVRVEQPRVLGAAVNGPRVFRIDGDAGQVPERQVAFHLVPGIAVLLEAVPPGMGHDVKRLRVTVRIAHGGLLSRVGGMKSTEARGPEKTSRFVNIYVGHDTSPTTTSVGAEVSSLAGGQGCLRALTRPPAAGPACGRTRRSHPGSCSPPGPRCGWLPG